MKEHGANYLLIAGLDDIAWVLNLRGNDVQYNPLFYSYLIIGEKDTFLFIDSEKTGHTASMLESDGVIIRQYMDVFDFVKSLDSLQERRKGIMIDPAGVCAALADAVPKAVKRITAASPAGALKAVKNSTQINCIRKQ